MIRKACLIFAASLLAATSSFAVGPITGGGVKTISIAPTIGITGTSSGGTAPILTLTLDPDLQSLASATAIDAMYYRGGLSTWSPVTYGPGLKFGGGMLKLSGPQSGTQLQTLSDQTIASAPTLDLTGLSGPQIDVTGTATITAITLVDGEERTLRFTGAATLTNNASIVVVGGFNRLTEPGAFAFIRGGAAGVVTVIDYHNATSSAVADIDGGSILNLQELTFRQGGASVDGVHLSVFAQDDTDTDRTFILEITGPGDPQIRMVGGSELVLNHALSLSGGDLSITSGGANPTFPAGTYGIIPDSRTISTTSPLTGGGDLSANRIIAINDAAADGSTKGAATLTASDFNATSGLVSLDYTNGQKATTSLPGFLSAADWTTFNGKQAGNSNLTSWAAITRASGFDTFVATPSSANMAALLTDESGTGPVTFGTVDTAATASTLVLRDANGSINVNNIGRGYLATATSGTPFVLTVASAYYQNFTGSTAQEVDLPVASTLTVGWSVIINNNTGAALLTVKTSGGNTKVILAGKTTCQLTCILASGTGVASWQSDYNALQAANSSKLFITGGFALTVSIGAAASVSVPGAGGTVALIDTAQTFTQDQSFAGDIINTTAGKGLQLQSGTGARAGNATMVGGTVTVTNSTVDSTHDILMLTRKTSGGTIGTAITYTLFNATSFTINSDNILDASTFSYMLVKVN